MQQTVELKATLKQDIKTWPDHEPFPFLMHEGETFDIERVGNGGVYTLTPFGEVFIPFQSLTWHECGPLCAEHGDPRDTSVIVRCYFGCGNIATTTRTRPDGAVKNCPTCKDCADLIIDEQNYNDYQAYMADPERVR